MIVGSFILTAFAVGLVVTAVLGFFAVLGAALADKWTVRK